MWELYVVTLLVIVSFEFYVMNFVDFVIDCYSHITSHVSQAFASCTHYTSYSLLNLVHYIVCDFVVAIKIICSLILMQNVFNIWVLRKNWLNFFFFWYHLCLGFTCIALFLYQSCSFAVISLIVFTHNIHTLCYIGYSTWSKKLID